MLVIGPVLEGQWRDHSGSNRPPLQHRAHDGWMSAFGGGHERKARERYLLDVLCSCHFAHRLHIICSTTAPILDQAGRVGRSGRVLLDCRRNLVVGARHPKRTRWQVTNAESALPRER